jgi:hypothetical protein
MDFKVTPKNGGAEVLKPHALCPIAHIKRKMVFAFTCRVYSKHVHKSALSSVNNHEITKNI